LQKLIEQNASDAEKFYSRGNKAAGTRLRKGLQHLKKTAQEVRQEIALYKKERLK
jgi:hypothetical protein